MATKRTYASVNSFESNKRSKLDEEQECINDIKAKIKHRRELFISALESLYRDHVSVMKLTIEKISGMCKADCFSVQYTIDTLRKIREIKSPADNKYDKMLEFFNTNYDVIFMTIKDNYFLNECEDIFNMACEDMDKLFMTVFKDFLEEDPTVCQR